MMAWGIRSRPADTWTMSILSSIILTKATHSSTVRPFSWHLLAADAVVDEKVRADGLAHRLDNHNGEPGPIFQTAAEAVGTVVIGRGQELASSQPWAPCRMHISHPARLRTAAALA